VRQALQSSFKRLADTTIALLLRGPLKELARRECERGGNGFRWFTSDEAAIAIALSNIIVPSDDATPGLDDIDVLGPPAVVLLDKVVLDSVDRQELYAQGLMGFDLWATRTYGCSFGQLKASDQEVLLVTAERIYSRWATAKSKPAKMWHMLISIIGGREGSFFAARLFPRLRDDCLRIFYTSRVAWVWLRYDGPPMNDGYPQLASRLSLLRDTNESATHQPN
jgi:hypothetical protein